MNYRSFVSSSTRLITQPQRRFHGSSIRKAIMMPAMSPYMTEGTIRRWVKKEGDSFLAGDVLLQIESGYCGHTLDVEAQKPGVMGKILSPEGSTNVAIEQVIALAVKTPGELVDTRAQAEISPPPTPTPLTPAFQPQHQFSVHPTHGTARLEFMKSPVPVSLMAAATHRTSSAPEMHTEAIRSMVMDHTSAQHQHHAPQVTSAQEVASQKDEASRLRKTIVTTLSRKDSGSKSHEYFDSIL